MSFLSIFRRKKNNKTELNEKKLLSQDDVKLDDEVRLDFKEENIELNKCKKITDEKLINYIISVMPEIKKYIDNKTDKSFTVELPEVKGNFKQAKELSNKDKLNKANLVLLSSEIASNHIMNELKHSFDEVNYQIHQINSYLSSEYKSKIEELSFFLGKIITFKNEMIDDNDRRLETISQVENHISSGIQLFKQAIIMITEYVKDIKDNYNKYEKAVYEIDEWVSNLQVLYGLIAELCKIDYILYQGSATIESCAYDLDKITPEINDALLGLQNWHIIEQMKLGINLEDGVHKNTGLKTIIKKFLSKQEDHKDIEYSKIPDEILNMINHQMNLSIKSYEIVKDELFQNGIKLVINNGDIYFNSIIC